MSGYFGVAKLSTPKSLGDQETMMGRLLVHLLCLMQFNTHGVAESTDRWDTRVMVSSLDSWIFADKNHQTQEFENKQRVIAHGLFPTLCLLNHSCDNNVYKYFAGDTVVVIAHKNILEGEEVTEEYFPSVQAFPKDQRRIWLMEHYWFDCQCYACDKDLPQIQTVPTQYSK